MPRGAYSMLKLFSGKIGCNTISRAGIPKLKKSWNPSGSKDNGPRWKVAPFDVFRPLARVSFIASICVAFERPVTICLGRTPLITSIRASNMITLLSRRLRSATTRYPQEAYRTASGTPAGREPPCRCGLLRRPAAIAGFWLHPENRAPGHPACNCMGWQENACRTGTADIPRTRCP
jgi:hypothetical protein